MEETLSGLVGRRVPHSVRVFFIEKQSVNCTKDSYSLIDDVSCTFLERCDAFLLLLLLDDDGIHDAVITITKNGFAKNFKDKFRQQVEIKQEEKYDEERHADCCFLVIDRVGDG